ncbi:MAG: AmmeMemoRadiSam system protein B [Bryobacteraceae bacterium]
MKRVLLVAALLFGALSCARPQGVREPAVAGAFYPGDPKELAAMVDGFIAKAQPPQIQDVIALVSPHAGYPYSGQVAAYSYALLKGRKISRVVVIAPSHYDAFDFTSVFDGSAYKTPLGTVPVDRAFVAKLASAGGSIRLSGHGHTVTPDKREHALEDQLPFLQRLLGQFELVPVVMGRQDYGASRDLGVAVARLITGPETLILASSDLSHYHPYEYAVNVDHKTLRAIEEWDYLSLSHNFERNIWEACGGAPIVAAMIAAERLGANKATVLKYANSGDVNGDKTRVVGYGAVAIYKAPGGAAAARPEFSLNGQEKAELLSLAHRSVEAAVKEHKLYDYTVEGSSSLTQERGAFVTLREHGDLRGCIGYTSPIKPLPLVVRDVAAYAAMQDPRFSPVSPQELGQLEYEISVLSPLHHLRDTRQIEIGTDGLLIVKGDKEGLLLPQVASDEHWDRKTFLEQLCRKAGLPTDAWRDPASDIFAFTALVFGEHARQ